MTSSHACSVVVYSSLRIFVACFSCWHFTKKTGSIKKLLCRCHPYKRWWKYKEKQNKIVLSIFSKYFHAFFFFLLCQTKTMRKMSQTNSERTKNKSVYSFHALCFSSSSCYWPNWNAHETQCSFFFVIFFGISFFGRNFKITILQHSHRIALSHVCVERVFFRKLIWPSIFTDIVHQCFMFLLFKCRRNKIHFAKVFRWQYFPLWFFLYFLFHQKWIAVHIHTYCFVPCWCRKKTPFNIVGISVCFFPLSELKKSFFAGHVIWLGSIAIVIRFLFSNNVLYFYHFFALCISLLLSILFFFLTLLVFCHCFSYSPFNLIWFMFSTSTAFYANQQARENAFK